jgi:hypothetical protein
LILLDDGFQHRRVKNSFNLLLIDSPRFLGNRFFIPTGILRDNIYRFNQSDIIILTKITNDNSKTIKQLNYLKQFNNRWFVFGLNEKYNVSKWNIALDRIKSINECSNLYIDTVIDWEDHFYDIIGVTTPNEGKIEEIELVFTNEQAKYINTKPLHPSQRATLLDNGELRVMLSLIPNFELEMTILSFGDRVRVVRPIQLKNRIIKRLKSASDQYF